MNRAAQAPARSSPPLRTDPSAYSKKVSGAPAMPDKLGSEERSTRDPTTPDPLAGRLRSEKLRRAKAREMAAQERALTTPVAAAAADLHLAEAGSVSASELSRETPAAPPARKSLDYESKPAAKDNKSASGKQATGALHHRPSHPRKRRRRRAFRSAGSTGSAPAGAGQPRPPRARCQGP